jgi:uncharacterized protein (TIGR04255 family)
MNATTELKLDLAEEFPHLPRAPIVEAAIEVRTRAESAWDEAVITEQVKSRLPEYPKVQSQTRFVQEITFGAAPSAKSQNAGWHGLTMNSDDGTQTVQFNRDSFVFGRLKPYENWPRFFQEALRLWSVFVELAHPAELQRIGLRFINQINLPFQEAHLADYIQPAPAPPQNLELPFHGFMHHDVLAVPGHPYAINVIRTIQTPPNTDASAVILDIDVFTLQPFQFREAILEERLPEMRWLKNKVFFGSVTPKALESFK